MKLFPSEKIGTDVSIKVWNSSSHGHWLESERNGEIVEMEHLVIRSGEWVTRKFLAIQLPNGDYMTFGFEEV